MKTYLFINEIVVSSDCMNFEIEFNGTICKATRHFHDSKIHEIFSHLFSHLLRTQWSVLLHGHGFNVTLHQTIIL